MRLALLCVLLAGVFCASAESIVAVDDAGREVTLPAPADRIVSLSPHLTEILYELGVGDRIVGTVRYADYPEAAKEIPRLGDAFSVSVESVLSLRPDIVFAWMTGGAMNSVERLIELGVPVYINEAPTLDSIPRTMVGMARLVGREQAGEARAAAFRERLAALDHGAGDVRVFFQISDERLYTVSGDHLIGQAIGLCGGVNVFQASRIPVPLVGQEAVVAAQPDIIVITQVPGTPEPPWGGKWRDQTAIDANIVTIDPNLISRPGPRMAEGISQLCALIDGAR